MTKKIVITGGPCSGKSTIINALNKRGYAVIHEVARDVISERINNPLTFEEHLTRINLIFAYQQERESKLSGEGLVFLDRGNIDHFAYQKHLIGEIIDAHHKVINNLEKYHQVFVLDRLPFEHDGLRIEKDDSEAQIIHNLIIEEYRSFGYELIFVPVMELEKRVEFILKFLKGGTK